MCSVGFVAQLLEEMRELIGPLPVYGGHELPFFLTVGSELSDGAFARGRRLFPPIRICSRTSRMSSVEVSIRFSQVALGTNRLPRFVPIAFACMACSAF